MKTIIDKITGKVLFATADDKYEVLANEMAVNEILIDNFVKPYFNLKTKMNNTINDITISTNNNDLFIKPKIQKQVSFENNDTDNSLIPSIDDISI